MKQTLSLLACVAAACAQVEISSEANDAVVRRQITQTASFFDMSRSVVALEAHFNDGTVNDYINRIAENTIARTTSLAVENAVFSTHIERLQTDLEGSQSQLNAALGVVNAQLAGAAAAANAASAQASTAAAAQAAELDAQIQSSMTASASTTTAQLSRAAATAASTSAQLTASITAINSTMTAGITVGIASKLDARVNMWSGGCSNRGGSGWAEFCLNVVHFDTAAPRFARKTGSRFHALERGIYTMDFRVIAESCNWAHILMYVAGRHWLHMNHWQGTGHWQHNSAHLTHKINTRQEFWARKYSGCWNAWHQTDNSGHARMTVKYDGAWNGQG